MEGWNWKRESQEEEEEAYRGGEEGLVPDLGEHRHGQRLGEPLQAARRGTISDKSTDARAPVIVWKERGREAQ